MVGVFLADERGAVTIDWVAVAAGVLLLGVAVVYAVYNDGVDPATDAIIADLETVPGTIVTGSRPDFTD